MANLLKSIKGGRDALRLIRRIPGKLLPNKVWVPIRRRILRALPVSMPIIPDAAPLLELADIDRDQGLSAGNVFFWESSQKNSWRAIENRLFFLMDEEPELILEFTNQALLHATATATLVNLARSMITKEPLAAILRSVDLSDDSPLYQRVRLSQSFSASLVAAAILVLTDEDAGRFTDLVGKIHPKPPKTYSGIIDSFATIPTQTPSTEVSRGIANSLFRTNKHHRLIIASTLHDRRNISLFFGGADKVTVFAPHDIYGRADFTTGPLHCRPDDIFVDHSRSRITRFSAAYHTLHEQTRLAARNIVEVVEKSSSAFGHSRRHAEVWLADDLFFSTLRLAALVNLIASQEFDHIVIALDDDPASTELCRFLAGVEGLDTDPRVEILSTSVSVAARSQFAEQLGMILDKTPPTRPFKGLVLPPHVMLDRVDSHCRDIAGRYKLWESVEGRARLLFATASEPSYNTASAAYFHYLREKYHPRLVLFGDNAAKLFERTAYVAPEPVDTQLLPLSANLNYSAIAEWLTTVLVEVQCSSWTSPLVAHMIGMRQGDIVNGLQGYLQLWRLVLAWFQKMQSEEQLPQAVLVSPIRNTRAALIAAAARQFGVPSIGLESHGVNANYCRYTRVYTDYYTVMSTFFRDEAVKGFGIPTERCRVIGTPRHLAPREYDRLSRTVLRRGELSSEFGIDFDAYRGTVTFLTQPSAWEQISEVWRIILAATSDLNIQILLKVHPEESSARRASYLRIAHLEGAGARVQCLNATPESLMEASDMVLSCYSIAVLEAVLLRRPVACVTNGDMGYPVDQHLAVDAPLYRDVASLKAGLEKLLADPEATQLAVDRFLSAESQFIDGPMQRLENLIDEVTSLPASRALRIEDAVPESNFLPGPHPIYNI